VSKLILLKVQDQVRMLCTTPVRSMARKPLWG